MFEGPAPPPGRVFCAVCVMMAKAAAVDEAKDAIAELARQPNGTVEWFQIAGKLPEGVPVQVAVTRALFAVAPQLGPLDVCWSHAGAVVFSTSGLAVAGPGQMPGGFGVS
jgi:hypothetical protein